MIFVIALLVALPLGVYLNNVYRGRKSLPDFLKPLEKLIFRVCRVDSSSEMNWKQYLLTMDIIYAVWLLLAFLVLQIQGSLFLNLAGNPSMEWSLGMERVYKFFNKDQPATLFR